MAGKHKDRLRNPPTQISDDDWNRIFKRDKKNEEKNRYKRTKKKKL